MATQVFGIARYLTGLRGITTSWRETAPSLEDGVHGPISSAKRVQGQQVQRLSKDAAIKSQAVRPDVEIVILLADLSVDVNSWCS